MLKAIIQTNSEKRKANLKAVKKYQKTEKGKRSIRTSEKRFYLRNPERSNIKNAVHYAVIIGKLPHLNTLQCHFCPAKAEQYHHHLGYEPEHRLDVIPVCRICHRKCHQV